MSTSAALPRDAENVLKLAARSMFDLFSSMGEGNCGIMVFP